MQAVSANLNLRESTWLLAGRGSTVAWHSSNHWQDGDWKPVLFPLSGVHCQKLLASHVSTTWEEEKGTSFLPDSTRDRCDSTCSKVSKSGPSCFLSLLWQNQNQQILILLTVKCCLGPKLLEVLLRWIGGISNPADLSKNLSNLIKIGWTGLVGLSKNRLPLNPYYLPSFSLLDNHVCGIP